MKRSLIFMLIMVDSLTSCNVVSNDSSSSSFSSSIIEESSSSEEKRDYISCIKTLDSNKTYIEVDGLPYNLIGAQLRVDGFVNRDPNRLDAPKKETDEEIERYFKLAKDNYINTLELAIQWKDVEKEYDVYNYDLIDKLLSMANKYDLKCEFLWFSTNMCGDGHSYSIPDYILNDKTTYPCLELEAKISNSMYGDFVYPILDNENLMNREYKAINNMLNHVYEWNNQNGNKNPLIGMQIHNESDGQVRWRVDQRQFTLNGKLVSKERIWEATLKALDNAGKAVHDSKYKIYTRCNMTTSFGVNIFPQCPNTNISPLDVLALDGIDIIGDDPYTTNPEAINSTIRNYSVNGNYPHIAENMGNYSESPSLFLNAYQAGGSYMFYDLATPNYFIYLNGNGSYQMDQGLFKPDLTNKAHTSKTVDIMKGISSMGSLLPTINSTNFVIFNASTMEPSLNYENTANTSSISFTYKTDNGGIAFAIEDKEYVYLYSTSDAKYKINNASFYFNAEIGHFDKDLYLVVEKEIVNPEIDVKKNKLYRIKIRNVN